MIRLRAIARLLAFAALLAPSLSQAAPGCQPPVERWIARAADAIGERVRLVECGPARVKVELAPEGAAPVSVEITADAAHAFRRAGRLGLSPVVEVPDWKQVPAPQRRAFDDFSTWADGNDDDSLLPGQRSAPARPLPLLLCAGLVLALLARRRNDRFVAPSARPLAALFLVGLALRAGLGVWGPWHVNGQGPLWIAGALEPLRLAHYGPGYPELFGGLARLAFARADLAVALANLVASSLIPPLAFGVARRAGLDPPRAFLAALALALDPIAIRSAPSEAYFTTVTALAAAATFFVLDAPRALRAGDRLRAALALLAAAAFAAQAARVHPAAWVPVALVPLAGLLDGGARRRRDRIALAGAAAATIALVLAATSGSLLLAVWRDMRSQTVIGGDPLATRVAIRPALVAIAAALPALLLARPRAPVLVAAAHLAALVATRVVFAQSPLWQASFDRLFFLVPAIALFALVPARIAARPAAAIALAFVAPLILLATAPRTLRARTTEQLEYTHLRRVLARMPADCRALAIPRAGDRIVELPGWDAPEAPRRRFLAAAPDGTPPALEPGACVWLVETSICTSSEGRPGCEHLRASFAIERDVDRATLPAAPSHFRFAYDRPAVEIRVTAARAR